MRRNVRTEVARDILRLAIIGVWACEPRDLSLLHVLFYIRSAGSLERLTDTEGGAQQDRVVGGTQLIALRMAEQLGEGVVELSTPVRGLAHGDGVTVTSDRHTVAARRAIVAVPPTLAARIAYDPPLPAIRDGLSQRMAQGSVVKCMAIYERPFWRDHGFGHGDQHHRPGLGRVRQLATRRIPGSAARSSRAPQPAHADLSVAERRARSPSASGGSSGPTRRSRSATWTGRGRPTSGREAATAASPPGAWTDHAALRAPIGPIHWAGAETALVWNGYMDGAVGSGEDAARAVLASLD